MMSLTANMIDMLTTLLYAGKTEGFGFTCSYDGTRKALVKRGLIVRKQAMTRACRVIVWFELTDAGRDVAKALPPPVESDNRAVRELAKKQARLLELKAEAGR